MSACKSPYLTFLLLAGCVGRVTIPDQPDANAPDSGASDAVVTVPEASTPDAAGDATAQLNREATACRRYAIAQCERMAFCNGTDPAPCRDYGFECPEVLFSPGTGRTIENVLDCTERFATWSCDDIHANRSLDCMPTGTLAVGEPCKYSTQCASSYCTYHCPQVCGSPAEPGGACSNTVECPYQQECDNGICRDSPAAARRKLGEPCSSAEPCDDELNCAPPPDGGAWLCVTRPAPREMNKTCEGSYECVAGSYCDAEQQVCLPPPGSGQPCARQAGNPNGVCADGLRCFSQRCSTPGAEGDPCDRLSGGFGQQCASGLQCDCRGSDCTQGYCFADRYEYETCDDTHVCANGYGLSCVQGLCRFEGSNWRGCQ